MARMRRFVPYTVAVLAVCAVLLPALRTNAGDSYPLSSYPMFTADREREEPVATAVGLTPAGDVVRLSPEEIAGTDEVIHAAATVSRAVTRDRADDLCREIVQRVAGKSEVHEIEVRTETYDTIAWFRTGEPLSVKIHARCRIP